MARVQNIKSDGLTYSVEVMRRATYGESGRMDAGDIWDGNGIPNATAIGAGTSFTAFDLNLDREASLSLPFIGFDFNLDAFSSFFNILSANLSKCFDFWLS